MAYAEKRGKGPRPWRVKYKLPTGKEDGRSGFETKAAALAWGRDQEAKIREGRWTDRKAGEITVDEWIGQWLPLQDVGISTEVNRDYLIRRFIRPAWGDRALASLTTAEVAEWENNLATDGGVSRRTARDARSLLCTVLGDAAAAKPPLIPYNPAVRPRNRGRKTGRRLLRSPQRTWATPLETLLIAERAALLSGRDDDFTLVVTIGYTGLRWGEAIGLEREHLQRSLVNVEWQLREVNGVFHRIPPKDDSYRSTNWEPRLPVDLPPFLAALVADQAEHQPRDRCACRSQHGGSGQYVFTGPDGGHYRRSNYARRIFRPSCDGRYEPVKGWPGKLVIADATTWPGCPAASWRPATPDQPFAAPAGKGVPLLVSTDGKGRCPCCGHAVVRRRDGRVISHPVGAARCAGSGEQPAEDAPLVCWLPVKNGLTPHGLRHSHKTWMAEDGIPEILAEQRLGHEVPEMRGLYAHASERMRRELMAALQERWEDSIRSRAALDPHSPVPLLDGLLEPFRDETTQPETRRLALAPAPPQWEAGDEMISQIPPKRTNRHPQRVG